MNIKKYLKPPLRYIYIYIIIISATFSTSPLKPNKNRRVERKGPRRYVCSHEMLVGTWSHLDRSCCLLGLKGWLVEPDLFRGEGWTVYTPRTARGRQHTVLKHQGLEKIRQRTTPILTKKTLFAVGSAVFPLGSHYFARSRIHLPFWHLKI